MGQYMLGLYEKAMPQSLSWTEKLLETKRAGFDFLEMSIDETDAKLKRLDSPEEIAEISRAMMETGVEIRSLCLSAHRKYPLGSLDPATQRQSLAIFRKTVALAAKLGIRIIMLAGYDVYYEQSLALTKAIFKNNLEKCVAIAAKEGIVLGFETMETEFMNTVYKAMYYVNEINSPYLQVYPDSGNITNAAITAQSDVVDDIRSGKGHIVAFHLKETVPGIFREIPFGKGHVDFAQIIQTAWQLGVRRYVAEFWYKEGSDWRQDLLDAHLYLSEYLSMAESQSAK